MRQHTSWFAVVSWSASAGLDVHRLFPSSSQALETPGTTSRDLISAAANLAYTATASADWHALGALMLNCICIATVAGSEPGIWG